MKLEAKPNCPLDSFNPCRELQCAWFLKVQGTHPNTGADIDEWGCSMSWMPVLMLASAREQKGTAAAVESFRNEMVKNNEVGQRVLLAAAGVPQQAQKLILESGNE